MAGVPIVRRGRSMIRLTSAVACVSIMVPPGASAVTKYGTLASNTKAVHLRVDDRVDDLLERPAFAGFGRLILPWDDRRYDPNMLRNIGSLLPYHTHVDGIAPPAIMERRVAALRRLGTEVEYRKYRGVGHGFGLGMGTPAEGWIEDALRVWTKQLVRQ